MSTTRLWKESREMLPFLAGTLALIVLPYAIWTHPVLQEFSVFFFMLGTGIMGGTSFGAEFQHRTFSLLVSQPVPRRVIWREKMLVLGSALGLSAGLAWVFLTHFHHDSWLDSLGVVSLAFFCAFCGAPWLTLGSRSGLIGAISCAGVPAAVVGVVALIREYLLPSRFSGTVGDGLLIAAVVIYCPVAYWLGRQTFVEMQDLAVASRELSVPTKLEEALTRPFGTVFARFKGPMVSLVKKEFRLQQVVFALAGLFCLMALAGAIPYNSYPEWAKGVWGGSYALQILIVPLVAGAIATAEEKAWGISEWHLTLPPSALKQWTAKSLTTLLTSLGLGVMLPAALVVLWNLNRLFGPEGAINQLPPLEDLEIFITVIVCQMAITSAGMYAGSVCKTTLWAILLALGMAVGFAAFTSWLIVRCTRIWTYMDREPYFICFAIGAGALVTVCLMQCLAFSNYRWRGLSTVKLVRQGLAILVSAGATILIVAQVMLLLA